MYEVWEGKYTKKSSKRLHIQKNVQLLKDWHFKKEYCKEKTLPAYSDLQPRKNGFTELLMLKMYQNTYMAQYEYVYVGCCNGTYIFSGILLFFGFNDVSQSFPLKIGAFLFWNVMDSQDYHSIPWQILVEQYRLIYIQNKVELNMCFVKSKESCIFWTSHIYCSKHYRSSWETWPKIIQLGQVF